MQALGRFTVKWNHGGIIQYVCWFSHSPHYFKCINGIRGIQMERAGDAGVLIKDDYLYFSGNGLIDPGALSALHALPTPFFVEQYLRNDEALAPGAKPVYKDAAPPRF